MVNGRISKFTIDKLVNMAARVGLHADLTIRQIPTAHARRSRSGPRIFGVGRRQDIESTAPGREGDPT